MAEIRILQAGGRVFRAAAEALGASYLNESLLLVEIEGGRDAVLAEGMFYGYAQVIVNQALVLELDLLFGGVYVDIDELRVDIQENGV